MKNIFLKLKSSYIIILQFSTWIGSLISPFVVSPPIGIYQQIWVNFSHFILTVLIGFLFIPLKKYNQKKHTNFWLTLSAILLISGTVQFFNWIRLLETKTIKCYEINSNIYIKGEKMNKNVLDVIDNYNRKYPHDQLVSDCDIIMKTPQIRQDDEDYAKKYWPPEEIRYNQNLILLTYMSLFVAFTLLLIFLMQSIFCYEQSGSKKAI